MANGPLGALMQSTIRADMQGRIRSLVTSGATAISPLGLLIAGPLSDVVDIRIWFWAGGIICVMIAVAGFFIPVVMEIEKDTESAQQPATDLV
jgi:DHA3 family macrolide efflux protein-like MFS transporter